MWRFAMGAGAVLRKDLNILEYWHCSWSAKTVTHLGVSAGRPKFQTFWEYLALLMCLEAWGGHTTVGQVLLVGDNTASLQDALGFKGR